MTATCGGRVGAIGSLTLVPHRRRPPATGSPQATRNGQGRRRGGCASAKRWSLQRRWPACVATGSAGTALPCRSRARASVTCGRKGASSSVPVAARAIRASSAKRPSASWIPYHSTRARQRPGNAPRPPAATTKPTDPARSCASRSRMHGTAWGGVAPRKARVMCQPSGSDQRQSASSSPSRRTSSTHACNRSRRSVRQRHRDEAAPRPRGGAASVMRWRAAGAHPPGPPAPPGSE